MKYLTIVILITLCISCKHPHDDPSKNNTTNIPPADTWWNDRVFYEIFVRSFYDATGNGVGDLKGVIAKLDYLNDGDPNTTTDLGITAIWLMPIYPSPSYHGYDVMDYKTVNPDYGLNSDLDNLIAEAHRRGIKVILDFVLNHTSDQHPWFQAAQSASSARRNWYIWSGSNPGYVGPFGGQAWYPNNGAYYYAIFSGGMPDLNYRNADVTTEIESITKFWHDAGIDGFRMDAAPLLIEDGSNQSNTISTRNWWRDYYAYQKSMDPAFMTVGEVWSPTAVVSPYADQRLDYCFEFDLASSIIDAIQFGNVASLRSKMQEVISSYPPLQYGTFLSNHDQNRIIESLGLDVAKAKAAAGILLSLPGIPYIYYGEEIGMRGAKPDEDIRKPMQWNSGTHAGFTSGTPWMNLNNDFATSNVVTEQADSGSLWNHYRTLIEIRTSTNALRHGGYQLVTANDNAVFAFLRDEKNDGVLAIHNLQSNQATSIEFSLSNSSLVAGDYSVTDLMSGADAGTLSVSASGGFNKFVPLTTLEGFSNHLLMLQKQ